jgi:hypothetical protein
MHSSPYLVDYYRSRGVSKLIYLDNGSSDGSEAFFASLPDTIVAQCHLNFRDWQRELRYCLASDYASGGWRLAVDADELLDYRGSDRMNIPLLVEQLADQGFTGLVAQMLEMVPRGSLRGHEGKTFEQCVQTFNCYSTDNITSNAYQSPDDPLHFFTRENRVGDERINIMHGGLRRTVFGENCLLTKHVLFKDGSNVLPMPHPHFTCGLSIADFTAVLYHYKFAGPYIPKEESLAHQGRLSHHEGKARLAVVRKITDVIFDFDELRENPTIDGLVSQSFLIDQPSDSAASVGERSN